ncbi:hypothetical protein PGT21_036141 [Puccinia graminis f. sp. tritici]|uniref:Uncharacterized protein n=1 Tax=Puccinia graminis f. sp. tritici TaxID=56615 RepID=A0A5B0QCS7_PUCGR|nr:hypothetical protein PGT21_035557 [Puccinia graminis f. sp. tritici]KAA1111060.1 hypothetical protein PGT21_036141 [Puccinia graminis f. sp. tritici]
MVQFLPKSFPLQYPAKAWVRAVLLGVALVQQGTSGLDCADPDCYSQDIDSSDRICYCLEPFFCVLGFKHDDQKCGNRVIKSNHYCRTCSHSWETSTCQWESRQHKWNICPQPERHANEL